MVYYIKRCPECDKRIHIHRVKRKLILKNICEHFLFYKMREPLNLCTVKEMFNAIFRIEIVNKEKMIVLR